MTTKLRQRTTDDLQLAGLFDHTLDAYRRTVRQLADPSAVALEMMRWLVVLWTGLTYVLQTGRTEQPAGPAPLPGVPGVRRCPGAGPPPLPTVVDTS